MVAQPVARRLTAPSVLGEDAALKLDWTPSPGSYKTSPPDRNLHQLPSFVLCFRFLLAPVPLSLLFESALQLLFFIFEQ